MEEASGEVDEKWVEEGEFHKSGILLQNVYPINRPAAQSTG